MGERLTPVNGERRIGFVLLDRPWPSQSGNHVRDMAAMRSVPAVGGTPVAGWFEVPEDLRGESDRPAFLGDGSRSLGFRASAAQPLVRRVGWKAAALMPGASVSRRSDEERLYPFSFFYDQVGAVHRLAEWAAGARLHGLVLRQFFGHYVPYLRRVLGIPIVADCHDVDSMLGREMVAATPWPRKVGPLANLVAQRRHDRRFMPAFDELWATCAEDRTKLQQLAPRRPVLVVPSVVPDPGPPHPLPGRSRIVLVGNMTYGPNAAAAEALGRMILPRVRERVPQATAVIAGGGMPVQLSRTLSGIPGLSLAGRVSDLAELYRSGDVVVAPLRQGGGPKLKLIEAMSFGRPIVTTTTGVYGLMLKDGQNCLVREGWADFAEACASLLLDSNLASNLANAGRRTYESLHTDASVVGALKESMLFRTHAGVGS